jgi:L-asparagine oxygenase
MGKEEAAFYTPLAREQTTEIVLCPQVCRMVSARARKSAERLSASIDQCSSAMATDGAAILIDALPQRATDALRELSQPSDTTLVVLRNVAELTVPPTPTSGFGLDDLLSPHDILLAGAMRLAGTEPCSFPFENEGRIGRNVVANPLQRGKASSHGYDVELFWHQDNCGQPFEGETLTGCTLPPMPKQIAFFGMRNSEHVPTRMLLVDDALSYLGEDTIKRLEKPSYRIGAPDSVVTEGYNNVHIDHAPILRTENGYRWMRYDPFLVFTKEPGAMLANARLAIALSKAATDAKDIILGAGDIMIFKNYRVMHMRVAFVPDEGPRSRWLRRFYGRTPGERPS